MKEITITEFCDFHWQDGEQRVPSAKTFTIGILEGHTHRPSLMVLQVCELHSKQITDVQRVARNAEPLANRGALPGTSVATVASRLRTRPGRPPSQQPGECPIPGCDVVRNSRGSIINHIWRDHRDEPRPVSGLECPDCDFSAEAAQAVALHRRRHHEFDPMVDALEGIKGFRVKRR